LKDERGKDRRHETTARIRFDAFDALLFASLRRQNGRDKARLRKTNYLSVTFFGQEPSKSEMDRILRECIAAAATIDSRKDILAAPWLRANVNDNPVKDRMLSPYGLMSAIVFQASGQKVVVHAAKPTQ